MHRGMRSGLAMELGALDGSPGTRSMTHEFELSLEWSRILIEGDPRYRDKLKANSANAFNVNAAICEKHSEVHFRPADYIGGILEFMGLEFLKSYHAHIYNAGVPPGNLSSIDWQTFTKSGEYVNVYVCICMYLYTYINCVYFYMYVYVCVW